MKRSLLFILFAIICSTGFAQLSFNAKIGLNLSNHMGNSDESKFKPGVRLGVGAEYSFTDIISLQPSLFFSQKGCKYSYEGQFSELARAKYDVTINQLYLEIPINAQFRFNISDNTNIVVATGPYLAVGVGGKTRQEIKGEAMGIAEETENKYNSFGEDGYNRFDSGWNIGVGVELSQLIIGFDTQLGFCKLYDNDNAPRNINLGFSVGYKF